MKVEFELSEHRVLVAAACGCVGLFALHAAFPALFDYWPKTSSELADWLSAVGTIGAVAAGFAVANRQHKRQLEIENKKDRLQEARNIEVERKNQIKNFWGSFRVFNTAAGICGTLAPKIIGVNSIGWPHAVALLDEVVDLLDVKESLDIPDMPLLDEINQFRVVMISLSHQARARLNAEPAPEDGFAQFCSERLTVLQSDFLEFSKISLVKVSKIATEEEFNALLQGRKKLQIAIEEL